MLGAGRSAIPYSASPSRPHPNLLDPHLNPLSVGEDTKALARSTLRESESGAHVRELIIRGSIICFQTPKRRPNPPAENWRETV
jgi:hypothetical protein